MAFAKSRIANLHWGLGQPPPRAKAAAAAAGAAAGAATGDFEPDPDAELPHMVRSGTHPHPRIRREVCAVRPPGGVGFGIAEAGVGPLSEKCS
jgi:hypothetical protein